MDTLPFGATGSATSAYVALLIKKGRPASLSWHLFRQRSRIERLEDVFLPRRHAADRLEYFSDAFSINATLPSLTFVVSISKPELSQVIICEPESHQHCFVRDNAVINHIASLAMKRGGIDCVDI